MRPHKLIAGMCAAAAVVLVATLGSPAQASEAQGVVTGSGYYKDDWNDEGIVSTTSHTRSNVAAMWQAVLWADKSLKPDGKPMSLADIDCVFGAQTQYTTKRWQHRYAAAGLVADGIVGPKTLHYAGRALDEAGGDRYVYVGLTANHGETGRYVTFVRSSSGVWSMYLGNELRPLYYGKATFSACR